MQSRRIGSMQVGPIGLGEMHLSLAGRPDEAQALRTIHAALDAGVTLIDTADAYCKDGSEMGHGERLTAGALAAYGGKTDDVLVATKGGHLRDADGRWPVDGSPEYLRKACDASLAALGVEAIALAWMLAKSPVVIPIPGSSRPETILDSAAAADLTLTDEELSRLG